MHEVLVPSYLKKCCGCKLKSLTESSVPIPAPLPKKRNCCPGKYMLLAHYCCPLASIPQGNVNNIFMSTEILHSST